MLSRKVVSDHPRIDSDGAWQPKPEAYGIDPEAVERMLSSAMNQMTFAERNAKQEEIHGVSTLCPEANPSTIQMSLIELQRELEVISMPEKNAFLEAQTFPATYVNDDWFRLRFLQAELFNINEAAKRMLRYLDAIRTYYGAAGLQQPIQLSDLSVEERKCLASGAYQLLPYRDRSGRRIHAILGNIAMDFPLHIQVKITLYFMWVASEDPETRRGGLVVVIWPNPNTMIMPDPAMHLVFKKAIDAFPNRGCAMHLCLSDSFAFRLLRAQIGLALPQDLQHRLKVHLGTRTEIEYILQSFGIYVDQIPVTGSGNLKLQNLNRWIKLRKALENEQAAEHADCSGVSSKDNIIECPGSNDVIFRSGNKVYLFHPGNLMFRNLIESKLEDHENAQTQAQKVEITRWIVDHILVVRKGRFVVWDKGAGWYTTLKDECQIREKVALYFREFKKRVRATANLQTEESSTFKFQQQDGRKRKRYDNDTCCS